MPSLSLHSPVGDLTVHEDAGAVVALDWGWLPKHLRRETPLLKRACDQLQAYFDGGPGTFDLVLKPKGSDFQQRVWRAMCEIPPGRTRTYGDIAKELGSAAQAVGGACGANPIPVIIPCHRIVAAAGLGGFSGEGGLETKSILLRLEGASFQEALL
jgi:methylated-DNA-[protein]-cysteine S-methyltransferase